MDIFISNKTVFEQATNKGKFEWRNVSEEMIEVFNKLKWGRIGEMVTEMDEVYVLKGVWLYSKLGIVVPMIKTPAVKRSMGRMIWWRKIMEKELKKWDKKIGFWGGGNYKNPEKVVKAFHRVGHSVTLERALELVEFVAEHGV